MICRVTDGIGAFCTRDVFGTRIAACFSAYGTSLDGVSFYAQYDGDRITAVLSDVFSNCTLTCAADADFEELRTFIRFLPLNSLLCDRHIREKLQIPFVESGIVMRFCGTACSSDLTLCTPQCAAFDYKKVYALLTDCGFSLGDYLPWLSDLAYRVQHGTANVYCLQEDERIVSTASVLFGTQTAVCLGAVGTDAAYRGNGYAGTVLHALLSRENGKRIELLCKPERIGFYEKLGFQQNGEFTV